MGAWYIMVSDGLKKPKGRLKLYREQVSRVVVCRPLAANR